MALPAGIQARYVHLTERMTVLGPNLDMPHTRALGNGLFEVRICRLQEAPPATSCYVGKCVNENVAAVVCRSFDSWTSCDARILRAARAQFDTRADLGAGKRRVHRRPSAAGGNIRHRRDGLRSGRRDRDLLWRAHAAAES